MWVMSRSLLLESPVLQSRLWAAAGEAAAGATRYLPDQVGVNLSNLFYLGPALVS